MITPRPRSPKLNTGVFHNRRKIILESSYALGDIVLLTAAVRDLHRCYPGAYVTDVRTPYPALWHNNPYVRRLEPHDPDTSTIKLEYPLINFSNHVPYHAIHGYLDAISEQLGIDVHGTEFKGDIHLSRAEEAAPSQVAELIGKEIPFWLISAGGKTDITIKWWDTDHYQAVVDHFRQRIQFVQVGASGDFHPRLNGTIDLRGKTSVRQLVNLVYHAQGVVCGVTGLMHLAAAMPAKPGISPLRPCVVVAGGREPAHWEAYPHHQFIHTIGSLPCCAQGGCWKSRTLPLGDKGDGDRTAALCSNRVHQLPRCMDMISADEVIRRVESYFDGGVRDYLSRSQKALARRAVAGTQFNAFDHAPLLPGTARPMLDLFIQRLPAYPGGFHGRGIIICAGGVNYFTNAWVCVRMLRRMGCKLPIQIWHLGPDELDEPMRQLVAPFGVECVDAFEVRKVHPCRLMKGWELKPYAMLHSPFKDVLLLDADNVPARNPEFLFKTPEFRRTGAVFWPDIDASKMSAQAWHLCGLEERNEPAFESGQIVVDKQRCWRPLRLTKWFNEHSDFWYRYMHGDKETFHLAWRKLEAPFSMPQHPPHGMRQHDFEGRLLFLHRNTDKWSLHHHNRAVPGFRFENECRKFIRELQRRWDQSINGAPPPPGSGQKDGAPGNSKSGFEGSRDNGNGPMRLRIQPLRVVG
jgi:ADP-heptose:LPS heptosyltransferase